MRTPKAAGGVVLTLIAAACLDGRAQSEGTRLAGALATIHADDMRARVSALAHDSMRGRDTPSPELDKAAGYIADQFRSFGLEPGGPEGGYVQRYPITVRRAEGRARIHVVGARGNSTLEAGDGFALFPRTGIPDGEPRPVWLAASEPASSRGAPPAALWLVPIASLRGGTAAMAPWQRAAAEGGAAGLLFVLPDEAGSFLRRLAAGGGSVSLGAQPADGVPVALLTQTGARTLFAAHTAGPEWIAGGEAARPLGVEARVHAAAQIEVTSAPNVIGILRGGDPRLRDEYVVFSAHMDHLGVGAPLNGDSIYNGADDNASGTSAVLEIAQAMSGVTPRPRRSMAFLLVSGEEKGLLGSEWFAEHPTIPLGAIVANLNIDMVGRNWPDTLVAVGKAQSSLGATVDSVARANPRLGLAMIDDPWPHERFYFRSDHYNFARKGIPILFFFSGVHEDYHRPSDESEKVDAEKAARVARLIALTGWAVANADGRPRWDPEARAQVVETP